MARPSRIGGRSGCKPIEQGNLLRNNQLPLTDDMKRREIAEKEERRRQRKAALEENAALERIKAIMKSGGRKGICIPPRQF